MAVPSFSGRRLVAFFLALSLLALSSCTNKPAVSNEILTQKVIENGRTPITVLVKYAFTINAFEQAVEKKFPQIDIIQVSNYTSDRGMVEYSRRLEHDDLTDIIMTWPLNIGEQYWSDRLLDLSGMPFTANYNLSMLNTIAQDSKLYYLPGPAQVRGIVYNKTLFEENGWEVPKDFDGFVALCQKIEKSGMRSIQLGFENQEVLDTAFVGYSYGNCYSKPQDAQWIADYNSGKGSFGDHFSPAFNTFQEMIDAGIWKKSDLNTNYAKREKMLFTRQCAMVEDSVLMARMGYDSTGCTDEFALMPFFSPGEDGDWARLYMVCYIGLNKHLAETQNKEKYDLVMQIMDYISSPEGQISLSADTGAMYSSVKNIPPPNIPEIQDLIPALEHGRYAIFPELKNAQETLRKGLAGMLEGTYTKEDVISLVDLQNIAPQSSVLAEEIGKSSSDFTLIETGSFITDAMRAKAGTDIALFLDNGKDGKYNGKGVSARFYEGSQTTDDVICIFPDLKHGEKGVLQTVEMIGEDLIKTLEHAIPVDNNNRGWFYYFSGLRMEYAPTAEAGNRIRKITDENGKAIEPQKIYTIAVMDQTVPEEFVKNLKDSDLLITDLLIATIKQQGTISPSKDERFIVCEPTT